MSVGPVVPALLAPQISHAVREVPSLFVRIVFGSDLAIYRPDGIKGYDNDQSVQSEVKKALTLVQE